MNQGEDAHHRPQFRVLADFQLERLYQATLTCLEQTGVHMLNAKARALLVDAGAKADGVRVRIPRALIEDTVAMTPHSFSLWDRPTGARDGWGERTPLEVCAADLTSSNPDHVHFGPGLTSSYFLDAETGQRRRVRSGDPKSTAVLCDALENFDYVMGLGLIDDVNVDLAPVYEFAEMVVGTGKPVIAWAYSLENTVDLYRIAVTVAGGEESLREHPFFALFVTSQAPLQHTDDTVGAALCAAEHGIPVIYLGGASAGLTAPVTGASALVISLASALSGLAAIQLTQPGSPVCIGGVPGAMDLRTARPAYGGPEMSLYSAAFSELSSYLGLPFMGTAGASESKLPDMQAAIEYTVQVVLSSLSSAVLVHDAGFLDCADIGSLEMLVVTDEIIALARRLLRGIEVTDETLMLDLIHEVGPGGHFVARRETVERCREEIWVPNLMDRDPWDSWMITGRKTMLDRARERVHSILTTHEPPPLRQGAEGEIGAILRAAEKRAART